MIGNGTRPAKHIHKEKHFHHLFGAADSVIPDFNLDTGFTMPDQDKDNAPTACTGYTVSDILTDIFKIPFDPDFSYAAALKVAGDPPNTNGASFHAAMQGGVALGVLPMALAHISSKSNGELFISDWANWESEQKKAALSYTENGILNVLGNGDAFSSILSALWTGKIAVSIGTPWFPEWSYNITNGIVQQPQLTGQYPSWHDWAIKGKKTINGVPYLIGKTWQGDRVGDGGWLYFSREAINTALSVEGTGALTFNPNALRWASLLGILIQRFPNLAPFLPQLLSLHG